MKYCLLIAVACMLWLQPVAAQQKGCPLLTSAIDHSVNPGTDFFRYATGSWMKSNPIPASERGWGIGNLVQEETYARLRHILEETANGGFAEGSSSQKIGDFYFSGMDTAAIEAAGITPLAAELALINKISNTQQLFSVLAHLQMIGVGAMFDFSVTQDPMNSDAMLVYFWQGGIGLPDRDYYFNGDARTVNIRREYRRHIARMLSLAGEDSSAAGGVYAIEQFLADSSRKLEDLRDPYANYNKFSVDGLRQLLPAADWRKFFTDGMMPVPDTVAVGQPEFFARVNAAVRQFPLAQWKAYLCWHLLNAYADRLSSAFEMERFRFRGTVMNGIKEPRPRWKRIQDAVERNMGELLGQVYVQKFYSPATKQRYEKLVDDIIEAYRARIEKLQWMSAETKAKALVKLNSISRKVGYPDVWKDFSSLKVTRQSYLRNSMSATLFWYRYAVAKLGKPVDRSEWNMTPQTYNAYYNPSNNEIVLPAAIFIIPGCPDSLLDDAVVYSYAGASTIGHELTHGFDDQGRQYDEKGNLSNWWTDEDERKFTERSAVMVKQFNDYVVLDSMHVNGSATLGENIADLGGILLGYDAFKKTAQYKEGKTIDGFTPEQRYWLGYALAWLGQRRQESLAQQIMTDVHSPEFLRVNGPLSNIPDFYRAFSIKASDAMYRLPGARVDIW